MAGADREVYDGLWKELPPAERARLRCAMAGYEGESKTQFVVYLEPAAEYGKTHYLAQALNMNPNVFFDPVAGTLAPFPAP